MSNQTMSNQTMSNHILCPVRFRPPSGGATTRASREQQHTLPSSRSVPLAATMPSIANLTSSPASLVSPPSDPRQHASPASDGSGDDDASCRRFPLRDVQEACLLRYFIEEMAHWVSCLNNLHSHGSHQNTTHAYTCNLLPQARI